LSLSLCRRIPSAIFLCSNTFVYRCKKDLVLLNRTKSTSKERHAVGSLCDNVINHQLTLFNASWQARLAGKMFLRVCYWVAIALMPLFLLSNWNMMTPRRQEKAEEKCVHRKEEKKKKATWCTLNLRFGIAREHVIRLRWYKRYAFLPCRRSNLPMFLSSAVYHSRLIRSSEENVLTAHYWGWWTHQNASRFYTVNEADI
jgi:hypothetical protein